MLSPQGTINAIAVDDYTKDGDVAMRNFLSRCTAFKLQIFNNSIGTQLENAMHLRKKFLATIFTVIDG